MSQGIPPSPPFHFSSWFQGRFAEICRTVETASDAGFDGAAFLPYLQRHRLRFEKTLNMLLPELAAPGERQLLDVGGGQLAWLLADRFPGRSVASDVSDRFAGVAEQLGVQHRVWNIVRDPPPFAEATFDLVTFTEVLEHLPPPPFPHVRRIASLLKPGGVLLLTVPNLAAILKRWKFLLFGRSPVKLGNPDATLDDGAQPHIREYTVPEVRQIMTACGLRVERLQTRYFGHFFLNRPLDWMSHVLVNWGRSIVVRAHKT